MSCMSRVAGWSCPNRVNRTTCSCTWASRFMAMVDGKETLAGALSAVSSSNEWGGIAACNDLMCVSAGLHHLPGGVIVLAHPKLV